MLPATKDWFVQENKAWYIIAGCLGALTLVNVASKGRLAIDRHRSRRDGREETAGGQASSKSASFAAVEASTPLTRGHHPLGAIFTLYQSVAHLTCLATPSGWKWTWEMSVCEMLVTLMYTGVVLGLGFHGCEWPQRGCKAKRH